MIRVTGILLIVFLRGGKPDKQLGVSKNDRLVSDIMHEILIYSAEVQG